MNKTFKLTMIAALGLFATSALAYNDCARLHIQVGNATNSSCQLVQYKVVHGRLDSSPPAVILPGYTERFDITQTFRGPEIVLEYACQGQSITFSSQQNYCYLEAGNIKAVVLSKDMNIQARYTSENGSFYWGKPGLVNWILSAA